MSTQTALATLGFWDLVVIAVVPASIAGLVGLGAPLLVEWRKQAAEQRKIRGAKLEELLTAIYEFEHWIDQQRGIVIFNNTGTLGASPLSKVQMLTRIYFPQFFKQTTALVLVASRYQLWILGAGQKRLAGKVSELNDGFEEVYLPYRDALSVLTTALAEYGQKEFGKVI